MGLLEDGLKIVGKVVKTGVQIGRQIKASGGLRGLMGGGIKNQSPEARQQVQTAQIGASMGHTMSAGKAQIVKARADELGISVAEVLAAAPGQETVDSLAGNDAANERGGNFDSSAGGGVAVKKSGKDTIKEQAAKWMLKTWFKGLPTWQKVAAIAVPSLALIYALYKLAFKKKRKW